MPVCTRSAPGALRSPAAPFVAPRRTRAPAVDVGASSDAVQSPGMPVAPARCTAPRGGAVQRADGATGSEVSREISFSISMSSAWSATSRFRRAFSSFSRRRSFASSAFMPSYWARHRWKVCSLMSSCFATSVPPPRRAGHHGHPVVLGDRGERGLHPPRVGVDHGGHPVEPPHPRDPAQATNSRVRSHPRCRG